VRASGLRWLVVSNLELARNVPVFGPLLWPIAAVIERGPGELLHHYMESGMLLGIKARVETSGPIAQVPAVAAP
jgi:hypothetical protein